MRHRRIATASDTAGYTLTEMLVVIAIIGLIAAILTPGLLTQLGRARSKAAQLQLDNVSAALESFSSDVGRYPTASEGLAALTNEPPGLVGWTGPYLKDKRSVSDPWNHPIVFEPADSGQSAIVRSLGADGKPGGSGVDRDLQSPIEP